MLFKYLFIVIFPSIKKTLYTYKNKINEYYKKNKNWVRNINQILFLVEF